MSLCLLAASKTAARLCSPWAVGGTRRLGTLPEPVELQRARRHLESCVETARKAREEEGKALVDVQFLTAIDAVMARKKNADRQMCLAIIRECGFSHYEYRTTQRLCDDMMKEKEPVIPKDICCKQHE